MNQPSAEPVRVLSGEAAPGLRWVVDVAGDDEDLYTMLRVWRGDQLVVPGSGFGGPKLGPEQLMNEWRGRTDDLPYFVMARTVPEVERVIATTDRGEDVELALSATIEQFGLRFAAAALPAGHAPASVRAEGGGGVLATLRQPMPPPGTRGR